MFAALIDERGGGMLIEIIESSADERKSLRGEIFNGRREIQFAIEPRFYCVLVGGFHVRKMAGHQRANVIGDGFVSNCVGIIWRAGRQKFPC